MSPAVLPTLERELALTAAGGHRFVLGCDEVGRGAVAGPVAVGIAVWSPQLAEQPEGLRDSKLLGEAARERMSLRVGEWVHASSVGYASAAEIDRHGIMLCLGLAGLRALSLLELPDGLAADSAAEDPVATPGSAQAGAARAAGVLLLDGSHDWLSPAVRAAADGHPLASAALSGAALEWALQLLIRVQVKADRDCASVAAASVVAKVARDSMMREAALRHPEYGWEGNKGYGSPAHLAAVAEHGASELHRRTWLKPAAEAASAPSG